MSHSLQRKEADNRIVIHLRNPHNRKELIQFIHNYMDGGREAESPTSKRVSQVCASGMAI